MLDREQKEFLSNLETGRAIVFSQGYSKALQVQIRRMTETDAEIKVVDRDLRESVYDYYAENYKKGIIINTQFLDKKPTFAKLQKILDISKEEKLCKAVYMYGCMYNKFPTDGMLKNIKELLSDENMKGVYLEISKAKSTKDDNIIIRKSEQVEFLNKYLKKFESDYLVCLLSEFCDINTAKTDKKFSKIKKRLQLKDTRNKIVDYIEKYVSDDEISLSDARGFRDML